MKKYALLLFLVLGMSTTTWGLTFACVQVTPNSPSCDDDITICVSGCIPGNCAVVDSRVCVKGSIITVDIYMECDCQCAPPYATKYNECFDIGFLCPGRYTVMARVHCADLGGCGLLCSCPGGVCAVGSAPIHVCCANPCWPWYWPCLP